MSIFDSPILAAEPELTPEEKEAKKRESRLNPETYIAKSAKWDVADPETRSGYAAKASEKIRGLYAEDPKAKVLMKVEREGKVMDEEVSLFDDKGQPTKEGDDYFGKIDSYLQSAAADPRGGLELDPFTGEKKPAYGLKTIREEPLRKPVQFGDVAGFEDDVKNGFDVGGEKDLNFKRYARWRNEKTDRPIDANDLDAQKAFDAQKEFTEFDPTTFKPDEKMRMVGGFPKFNEKFLGDKEGVKAEIVALEGVSVHQKNEFLKEFQIEAYKPVEKRLQLESDVFSALDKGERLSESRKKAVGDEDSDARFWEKKKDGVIQAFTAIMTAIDVPIAGLTGRKNADFNEMGAFNEAVEGGDLVKARAAAAVDGKNTSRDQVVVMDRLIRRFNKEGITDGKEMGTIMRDALKRNVWAAGEDDKIRKLDNGEIVFDPKTISARDPKEMHQLIEAQDASKEQKTALKRDYDFRRSYFAKAMYEGPLAEENGDFKEWKAQNKAKGITDPAKVLYSWKGLDGNVFRSGRDLLWDPLSGGGRGIVNAGWSASGMATTWMSEGYGAIGLDRVSNWLKSGTVRAMEEVQENQGLTAKDEALAGLRGERGSVRGVWNSTATSGVQMIPMFVGGGVGGMIKGAAGTNKGLQALGTSVQNLGVYGYAGVQGAQSIYETALQKGEEKAKMEGRQMSDDERYAVIQDNWIPALSNGVQTVLLTKLGSGSGVERMALGRAGAGGGGLTIKEILSQGINVAQKTSSWKEALRSIKPEIGKVLKTFHADAKGELIEETANQVVEGFIQKASVNPDKTFNEMAGEAIMGGFQGFLLGGAIPAATSTFSFNDKKGHQEAIKYAMMQQYSDKIQADTAAGKPTVEEGSSEEMGQHFDFILEKTKEYNKLREEKNFTGALAVNDEIDAATKTVGEKFGLGEIDGKVWDRYNGNKSAPAMAAIFSNPNISHQAKVDLLLHAARNPDIPIGFHGVNVPAPKEASVAPSEAAPVQAPPAPKGETKKEVVGDATWTLKAMGVDPGTNRSFKPSEHNPKINDKGIKVAGGTLHAISINGQPGAGAVLRSTDENGDPVEQHLTAEKALALLPNPLLNTNVKADRAAYESAITNHTSNLIEWSQPASPSRDKAAAANAAGNVTPKGVAGTPSGNNAFDKAQPQENILFDEETHTYYEDGQVKPSVTELKGDHPMFAFDEDAVSAAMAHTKSKHQNIREGSIYFGKNAEEIKAMWKANSEIGSKFHAQISEALLNPEAEHEPHIKEVADEIRAKIPEGSAIVSEKMVRVNGAIGTLDLFVEIEMKDGSIEGMLFDFKSMEKNPFKTLEESKDKDFIHPYEAMRKGAWGEGESTAEGHRVQLAAYKAGLEATGIKVTSSFVIPIDRATGKAFRNPANNKFAYPANPTDKTNAYVESIYGKIEREKQDGSGAGVNPEVAPPGEKGAGNTGAPKSDSAGKAPSGRPAVTPPSPEPVAPPQGVTFKVPPAPIEPEAGVSIHKVREWADNNQEWVMRYGDTHNRDGSPKVSPAKAAPSATPAADPAPAVTDEANLSAKLTLGTAAKRLETVSSVLATLTGKSVEVVAKRPASATFEVHTGKYQGDENVWSYDGKVFMSQGFLKGLEGKEKAEALQMLQDKAKALGPVKETTLNATAASKTTDTSKSDLLSNTLTASDPLAPVMSVSEKVLSGEEKPSYLTGTFSKDGETYTYVPDKGTTLPLSVGSLIAIKGSDSVLAFIDVVNGQFVFRRIDFGRVEEMGGKSERQLKMQNVNSLSRNWNTTRIAAIAPQFLKLLPKITSGKLSETDARKLLDSVIKIIAPGRSAESIQESELSGDDFFQAFSTPVEVTGKDAEGIVAAADGKFYKGVPGVRVDYKKFAAQLATLSRGHKAGDADMDMLVAMDAARQVVSWMGEENIHTLTFGIFTVEETEKFFADILSDKAHPFHDLLRITAKEQFPDIELSEADDTEGFAYTVASEMLRKLQQIRQTGSTSEINAVYARRLVEVINDKSLTGKVKATVELVKRFFERMRRILYLRQAMNQITPEQKLLLNRLNQAYLDAGFNEDVDNIKAKQTQEQILLTNAYTESTRLEIDKVAAKNSTPLMRLREVARDVFTNVGINIVHVDPETGDMTLDPAAAEYLKDNHPLFDAKEINKALAELSDTEAFTKSLTQSYFLSEIVKSRLEELDFNPSDVFDFLKGNSDYNVGSVYSEIWAGSRVSGDSKESAAREALEEHIFQLQKAVDSRIGMFKAQLLKWFDAKDISSTKRIINLSKLGTAIGIQVDPSESNDPEMQVGTEKWRRWLQSQVNTKMLSVYDDAIAVIMKNEKFRGQFGETVFERDVSVGQSTVAEALEEIERAKALLAASQQLSEEAGDLDKAALRSQAIKLNENASILDNNARAAGRNSSKEATVLRYKAALITARIATDIPAAQEKQDKFYRYMKALKDYNESVDGVLYRAIGRNNPDKREFGLDFRDTSFNINTVGEDADGKPRTKPANGTKALPFGMQMANPPNVTQPSDFAGYNINSPSDEKGTKLPGYGNPRMSKPTDKVEHRDLWDNHYRQVFGNAKYRGRHAINWFMLQDALGNLPMDLGTRDDFMRTAGFNLASTPNNKLEIRLFENHNQAFPGLNLYDQLFTLLDTMKEDGRANASKDFQQIIDIFSQTKAWANKIRSKVNGDGFIGEINGVPTLAGEAKVLLDRRLKEFDEQMKGFESALFGTMDLYFRSKLVDGEVQYLENSEGLIKKDGVSQKDIYTKFNQQISSFNPNGPQALMVQAMSSLNTSVKIVRKSLESFQNKEWQRNQEEEMDRTLNDYAYTPDHVEMLALRDQKLDPSIVRMLAWKMRFHEKSAGYSVGSLHAYELLGERLKGEWNSDGRLLVTKLTRDREVGSLDQEGLGVSSVGDIENSGHMPLAFATGEQGNTRDSALNEKVGGTQSTAAERNTRELMVPYQIQRQWLTRSLMFLGYGKGLASEGDANAAKDFAYDVIQQSEGTTRKGLHDLMVRGLAGAFSMVYRNTPAFDNLVEMFVEANPEWHYAFGERTEGPFQSAAAKATYDQLANDPVRFDPDSFAADILMFKAKFETDALEKARINEKASVTEVMENLLAHATVDPTNDNLNLDNPNFNQGQEGRPSLTLPSEINERNATLVRAFKADMNSDRKMGLYDPRVLESRKDLGGLVTPLEDTFVSGGLFVDNPALGVLLQNLTGGKLFVYVPSTEVMKREGIIHGVVTISHGDMTLIVTPPGNPSSQEDVKTAMRHALLHHSASSKESAAAINEMGARVREMFDPVFRTQQLMTGMEAQKQSIIDEAIHHPAYTGSKQQLAQLEASVKDMVAKRIAEHLEKTARLFETNGLFMGRSKTRTTATGPLLNVPADAKGELIEETANQAATRSAGGLVDTIVESSATRSEKLTNLNEHHQNQLEDNVDLVTDILTDPKFKEMFDAAFLGTDEINDNTLSDVHNLQLFGAIHGIRNTLESNEGFPNEKFADESHTQAWNDEQQEEDERSAEEIENERIDRELSEDENMRHIVAQIADNLGGVMKSDGTLLLPEDSSVLPDAAELNQALKNIGALLAADSKKEAKLLKLNGSDHVINPGDAALFNMLARVVVSAKEKTSKINLDNVLVTGETPKRILDGLPTGELGLPIISPINKPTVGDKNNSPSMGSWINATRGASHGRTAQTIAFAFVRQDKMRAGLVAQLGSVQKALDLLAKKRVATDLMDQPNLKEHGTVFADIALDSAFIAEMDEATGGLVSKHIAETEEMISDLRDRHAKQTELLERVKKDIEDRLLPYESSERELFKYVDSDMFVFEDVAQMIFDDLGNKIIEAMNEGLYEGEENQVGSVISGFVNQRLFGKSKTAMVQGRTTTNETLQYLDENGQIAKTGDGGRLVSFSRTTTPSRPDSTLTYRPSILNFNEVNHSGSLKGEEHLQIPYFTEGSWKMSFNDAASASIDGGKVHTYKSIFHHGDFRLRALHEKSASLLREINGKIELRKSGFAAGSHKKINVRDKAIEALVKEFNITIDTLMKGVNTVVREGFGQVDMASTKVDLPRPRLVWNDGLSDTAISDAIRAMGRIASPQAVAQVVKDVMLSRTTQAAAEKFGRGKGGREFTEQIAAIVKAYDAEGTVGMKRMFTEAMDALANKDFDISGGPGKAGGMRALLKGLILNNDEVVNMLKDGIKLPSDVAALEDVKQLKRRIEESIKEINASLKQIGNTKDSHQLGRYYHDVKAGLEHSDWTPALIRKHGAVHPSHRQIAPTDRQVPVTMNLVPDTHHPDHQVRGSLDQARLGFLQDESERFDFYAKREGVMRALAEFTDGRLEEAYKRVRGGAENFSTFNPFAMIRQSIKLANIEKMIMDEREAGAKSVAEQAAYRGMTVEAIAAITGGDFYTVAEDKPMTAEQERAAYFESPSQPTNRQKRVAFYRSPQGFGERMKLAGHLFDDGKPMLLMAQDARTQLMEQFPGTTKHNVDSLLKEQVLNALTVNRALAGKRITDSYMLEFDKGYLKGDFDPTGYRILAGQTKISRQDAAKVFVASFVEKIQAFVEDRGKNPLAGLKDANGLHVLSDTEKLSMDHENVKKVIALYSNMIEKIVYAQGHKLLDDEASRKVRNFLLSISEAEFTDMNDPENVLGGFANNDNSMQQFDLMGTFSTVFSAIEGDVILRRLAVGLSSPGLGNFGAGALRLLHGQDSRIRSRFIKDAAAHDTAIHLQAFLEQGFDGQTGREGAEAQSQRVKRKISDSLKTLGNNSLDHAIAKDIATLEGIKHNRGMGAKAALEKFYDDYTRGYKNLLQYDLAQRDAHRRIGSKFFNSKHIQLTDDIPMAKEKHQLLTKGLNQIVLNSGGLSGNDSSDNDQQAIDLIDSMIADLLKGRKKAVKIKAHAELVESEMRSISDAMAISRAVLSHGAELAGAGELTNEWKHDPISAFEQSYSSVPMSFSYAAAPGAETSMTKGQYITDPALLTSLANGAIYGGPGKFAGMMNQGRIIYRPLQVNGITSINSLVEDSIYRMNVAPNYEVLRRLVGRTETPRGIPTTTDSKMLNDAFSSGKVSHDTRGQFGHALAAVATELESNLQNDATHGVDSTRFARVMELETARFVWKALGSPWQLVNQSLGPSLAVIIKKLVTLQFRESADFIVVLSKILTSGSVSLLPDMVLGDHRAFKNFNKRINDFNHDVSIYTNKQGMDGIDNTKNVTRNQLSHGSNPLMKYGGYAANKFQSYTESYLDNTIGAAERTVGRAVFAMEMMSELRKAKKRGEFAGDVPRNVDELIKLRKQDIPTLAKARARIKVSDMLGQGDNAKKSMMFQNHTTSPTASALIKGLSRFSSQTSSTAGNMQVFARALYAPGIDSQTRVDAFENIVGTLLQNVLFNVLKVKTAVPLFAFLFNMIVGGDDEERAAKKAQKFANDWMVPSKKGLDGSLADLAKSLIFGTKSEFFAMSKDTRHKTADAAIGTAFAGLLSNSLVDGLGMVPVLGTLAGYSSVSSGIKWLASNDAAERIMGSPLFMDLETSDNHFDRNKIGIAEFDKDFLQFTADLTAPTADIYNTGKDVVQLYKGFNTRKVTPTELAMKALSIAVPITPEFNKQVTKELRLKIKDETPKHKRRND